ncbi:tetratricopeptide repeat protein 7B-like [Tripterygium wilfordii]|uniref:Tetratricopeptide repeat protein 7B-like n=1 Tax=Tripterygium wilfordii TaxID=458696 RepID=A0A7J7CRY7_TRIWF|nr:protein NPGR2-like [Tripterygium wilfordii]KAF5736729.1 tetratricopeptide repeat protein 7B-like [Tripterygium wilfordii]
MRIKNWINKWGFDIRGRLEKMMKCIRSGERLKVEDLNSSSESLATRDYSVSGFSSRAGEVETKVDNGNIEEAESSLRESGYLNYEEARALLGRLEYQRGNVEGALQVFEGIDIAAVTSRMKFSLSRRCEQNKRRSQSDAAPLMSMHAICLLLEAIFLKSKSLQGLGRFIDAAQSCKVILDTVESALPDGLPDNFSTDNKLQEILSKAVELLPELWKLAGSPQEVILSYRQALLYYWNLDTATKATLEKEFAVFLLYSGADASPPNLGSQMEGSFVPRNNIEEAILLLLILLRKFALKRIRWDPSIIDHLTFALSISGDLRLLAHQIEELLPGILERKEKYCTMALAHYGEGDNMVALNLLRNLLNNRENPGCILELLTASKICGENVIYVEEGINYVCKALEELHGKCAQMVSIGHCFLGLLRSAQARSAASDSERTLKQSEALEALEIGDKKMRERDPYIIHHLCLENAEQRKLDAALYYAKQLLKLEAGSTVKGYILLARILSAQKQFVNAANVINAALDQTGKWDQGELLQTKAKLQIAQGQLKNAVETYTHLLAILQVRAKSLGAAKKLLKNRGKHDRSLEMETWHDLSNVYISLSQLRDAEVCLLKSEAINPHSASRWHSTGLLNEAKGFHQEALNSFRKALDVEPTHVPSLISTACILRKLGGQSTPVIRGFLTDALRFDRTNSSAWYNLGLLYKADASVSVLETAECFEAAALLEESTPVEPFR